GVLSMAFSPEGHLLATIAKASRLVWVWDPTTRKLVRRLSGHNSDAMSLAFSPDGRYLASGQRLGTINVWEVGTGKRVAELRASADHPGSLAFAPTDQALYALGDGGLRLWQEPTRATREEVRSPDRETETLVRYWARIGFSLRGTYLAVTNTELEL